jgi:hypothetical protein
MKFWYHIKATAAQEGSSSTIIASAIHPTVEQGLGEGEKGE